ncbi:MAG: hypothetical protein RL286_797, partial [Bacteroidota bacterium]
MQPNTSLTELSVLLNSVAPVDQVGSLERIAKIQSRSLKGQAKIQGLRMALSMIDLTTLEGKDTPGKVRQMCFKAQHLHDQAEGLPTVAAVCVFPTMVGIAKAALANTHIKVAAVSTAFPAGQAPFEVKKLDTLHAVEHGADEIDMVISRGRFLAGDYNFVYDEIAAIKELCGTARLKVIFETGELDSLDQVKRVSSLAIAAGADFIKTSTGKIQPAATF